MSGFAGFNQLRNMRRGAAGLRGQTHSSLLENGDLVVGPAACIVRKSVCTSNGGRW
jgi:hypothetical protein